MSENTIIARRHADGSLWRVMPDGREVPFPRAPMRPMTEEEIEAAALSDPDCPPMTAEQLAAMRPANPARRVRRALRLTQEEFSARYHIPLGSVRDWEQGRTQPDQTALAYLRAIAGDAEAVWRALEKAGERPRPAAE